MKNPFTQLGNKFTMTVDRVRQTIFRQRQKDAGTKKETHRGKGGGGSSVNVGSHAIESDGKVKEPMSYSRYARKRLMRLGAQKRRSALQNKRRAENKRAARSRRINRIKRQNGKAA